MPRVVFAGRRRDKMSKCPWNVEFVMAGSVDKKSGGRAPSEDQSAGRAGEAGLAPLVRGGCASLAPVSLFRLVDIFLF